MMEQAARNLIRAVEDLLGRMPQIGSSDYVSARHRAYRELNKAKETLDRRATRMDIKRMFGEGGLSHTRNTLG